MIGVLAASVAAARGEARGDAAFATLEREYAVYSMQRFPVMATYLGGAAFDPSLAGIDGELRDDSPAAIAREDAEWRAFRTRFEAAEPAALSAADRIDRRVAIAQIDFLLHQHETLRQQERSLDTYVDDPFRGVDWQIQGMTATGAATRGTEAEWERVAARARAVPGYLKVAQEQIAAGVRAGRPPDWRVLEQFGLNATDADADYFERTLPALAAKDLARGAPGRERVLREIGSAGHAAAEAYRGLREYVAHTFFGKGAGSAGAGHHGGDADVGDGANAGAGPPLTLKAPFRGDRFAYGEANYDWALRNNLRLDTTARALYEQSWPWVEATRAQMITLARRIARSHGWRLGGDGRAIVRAVFDRLGERAPKTDAQMIQAYRDTGARLVEYARRTGLFDVPADYRLDVTFTPPPLQATIDGAAYYPAPPFKRTGVGRFYVSPTGDDPAALRQQHNLDAIPDLAAHEGFPGHDWHYRVMTEYRDRISPVRWLTPGAVEESSSMWEDSMAAEGWALYAEGLLAEPMPGAPHGFYTPEEHLYQLQGQLYRDLRVRIDTGIHTGRMPFEQAVTLFSEVVDFLPGSCTDPHALALPAKRASCGTARAAINRYARWPTQAITYQLGKMQILQLRARARKALGSKFSLQRFHLELMKQGTIPAGYFGDELLKKLKENAGR
jgi:uncharacterized protein (DUF885 family)